VLLLVVCAALSPHSQCTKPAATFGWLSTAAAALCIRFRAIWVRQV
jgi:hypothetical protein